MNEKGRQTKLLAAIAVLAMVVCVFAAVVPSDVSAASAPTYADGATIERGDLETTVATVSFYDSEGEEWDYLNGNTVPITNSSLGNTNMNITVDSTSTDADVITISGNLMGQPTGSQFDLTGAPSKFDYGFVFNLADVVDAEGDYGFGSADAPVYIGYVNAEGDWKILTKTGNTSTQLVYINSDRTSTTYYFSDETITQNQTSGLKSITVNYNFTLIPYGTYDSLVYRGDISTQNATVSFIDSVGAEWDYVSGNTEPITNSSLGNTNMNIVRDGTTSVTISGVLNNQTGNTEFTETGAPNGFEYGFVFNLADVVDSTGSYGFGSADAPVYIGYVNAEGDWKVLTKTGNTSTQLVYIDGERATGSTTYYFSDETIAEGETEGLASFTVNYNFTLKSTVDADSVSEAMESESEIIIYSGDSALTEPLTVAEGKTFIIDAQYLPETTTLASGAVLNLGTVSNVSDKTITFAGDSDSEAGTVVLSGFTGDNVIITQGSVEISGENLAGEIEVSGDVKITDLLAYAGNTGVSTDGLTINADGTTLQTVTVEDNISVNGNGLTLGENISFDATGKTITLNGTSSSDVMIEMGDTSNPDTAVVNYLTVNSIQGTGTIHVPRGATLTYNTISSGVIIDAEEGAIIKAGNGQGTENEISESQNVTGNQYLSANTTILSGVTLTVPRNAVLDLAGYNLIVYGTIEVQAGGTIISSVDRNGNTGTIVLMTGGSIINNGTIGTDRAITVSNGANTETQTVVMKQVNGVNFEIVRSGTGDARVYNMAISGDVSRISGASDPTLAITNVDINGNLTIGRDIDFTVENGTTEVAAGVTVTNNGELMDINGTFLLLNGATFVANNHVAGTVTVDVGTVGEGNAVTGTDANVSFEDTTTGYTTGITITSGRVTLPDPTDDSKSIVYQRMYVSGSLSANGLPDASNNDRPYSNPVSQIEITGTAFVNENLVVPDDVEMTIDGYFDVSSAGTVSVVEGQTGDISYYGARYVIEATVNSDTVETTYYTSFASAMEQIANADEQLIYVSGDYTISGTYTLANGQTIEFDSNASSETGVIVGESAVITVSADADVNKEAFGLIEGRVIVLEGTGYKPDEGEGIYAVVTVDSETNDTTYSGFKIALDNAQPGQTITVVDNATYRGSMVVPADVTVDVADDVALTVTGNVTVMQDGTLLLNDASELIVGTEGRDASITVSGTLTAEGATIKNTTGATVNLYSTGTTTVDSLASFEGVGYNAAVYVDVETVLTSVAAAVDYAEQNAIGTVTLYGTFTDTAAVDSDGVDIVVSSGAVVTLGTVDLNNAEIRSTGGTYTATVSGLYGEGDAAVASTVVVNKTTATIASNVTLNAEGVNQYAMTIDAIVNATQFTAGTFEVVGDEDTGTIGISLDLNGNSVSIASGATMFIGEDTVANISGGIYLVNNGTILIEGQVVITGNTTLGGDVSVAEGGQLQVSGTTTVLTVTGTVTVDADGAFQVAGVLQVGETPELLNSTTTGAVDGEVVLVDNAYVKVFAGASVADATITNSAQDEPRSTAYTINGVSFATIYLTGVRDLSVINPNVNGLNDVVVGENGVIWYVDGSAVSSGTVHNNVGTYPEVTTELQYAKAPIEISVGSHITLTIDNIVVGNTLGYGYGLAIGTHTINAVIDPGYSGTVTITFNGQTIQNGGTITITSDMLDPVDDIVLSATGQLTQDSSTVVIPGDNGDDGMGLTDILLIVLVILIVVMAIIVALRLMRS